MDLKIYKELESLSIAEKRLLGEALIVSAESEVLAPPISEAQRTEIRARIAYHLANPEEESIPFSELKETILSIKR